MSKLSKTCPLKIIIEGIDGAGKSTLISKLHNYYNKTTTNTLHLSYRDDTSFDFYYQVLKINRIIFDRQFLSELVYSQIFNRPTTLNSKLSNKLLLECKNKKISIIILDSDLNILKERLSHRKDEEQEITSQLPQIQSYYHQIAARYNIPIIDTSKVSFNEIIKIIEEEKIYEKYKIN